MELQPLVSVLIPMYNAQAYIGDTIGSVLSQSYTNIEVIIVDDSSTDGSFIAASEFCSDKLRVVRNKEKSKGACSARNYAFELCSGEYIQYLDADDLLHPEKIETHVRILVASRDKNAVAFCSLRQLYGNNLLSAAIRKIDRDYEPAIELQIDMWKHNEYNCPHCYLIPRALLELGVGWDETVLKNQDGEFFSRILFHANIAIFTADIYVVWRQTFRGVSSGHNIDTMRSQLDVIHKIMGLILSYENSKRTRHACAVNMSTFLHNNYPDNRPFIGNVNEMLNNLTESLSIKSGLVSSLIRKLAGWRLAARFTNSRFVVLLLRCIRMNNYI